MATRTIVYIDGFNLYYGALKGGGHKWLDLEKFFRLLRPHDDIQIIRYFTALVSGSARVRPETYLEAVDTLPLVETTLGRFKTRRVLCRVNSCTHSGVRLFPSQEEKRTDVNIGIHMVDDTYQDLCDRLIVISGDSDLVPAVNLVKTRFPDKEVVVYVPSRSAVRGAAVELRSAADKDKLLPLQLLKHAQLPNPVRDGGGGAIAKPTGW